MLYLSAESKSVGTKPSQWSYKQQGEVCGPNYAKTNSVRQSILQASTGTNPLEGSVRLRSVLLGFRLNDILAKSKLLRRLH